jgi:hypothetical protein
MAMDFECKPKRSVCACKSESFAAGTCEVPGFSKVRSASAGQCKVSEATSEGIHHTCNNIL